MLADLHAHLRSLEERRAPNRAVARAVGLACGLAVAVGALSVGGLLGSVHLVLAVAGVLVVVTDLTERRIRNVVVYPATAITVAGLLVVAATGSDWWRLPGALTAAVVVVIVGAAIGLRRPGALGMGDVKLAGLVAVHLGWHGLAPVMGGLLVAAIGAAVVGTYGILRSRPALVRLPFAPYLVVGAALALLLTS